MAIFRLKAVEGRKCYRGEQAAVAVKVGAKQQQQKQKQQGLQGVIESKVAAEMACEWTGFTWLTDFVSLGLMKWKDSVVDFAGAVTVG